MFNPVQKHYVDLHVHSEGSGNIGPILSEILTKVNLILTKETAMAQEFQEVKREVAETAAKMDEVLAVVTQVSTDLAAVRQQLADALAQLAEATPEALLQVAADLDAIQVKADAVIHPAPPTP